MKAAILYLSHNRFEYTKKSLTSIIENTDRSKYDLLLWDNVSTEPGMVDWLRKTCQDNSFDYVLTYENLGLTTAMNIQMHIMNKKANYDVFCHIANDVVVPKSWLDATFSAMSSEKVGVLGLNFEAKKDFEKEVINGIELQKIKPDGNVGGMHFCIHKRVYDLIGGFQDVKFRYGQQDANYSLKVKLLPNDWWPYYLSQDKYKGTHLGVNNALELTEENKSEELYEEYHNKMKKLLKFSGGDVSGGRNFRTNLNNIKMRFNKKQTTFSNVVNSFKFPEDKFVKVKKNQIKETTIDQGFFI